MEKNKENGKQWLGRQRERRWEKGL